jgi:hypothetical protein
LPFIELTKDVARNLASYSVKYGAKGCAKLDALVHIALEDHHLFPLSAALDPSVVSELDRQGWRSVSLVFLPFSAVFFAKPDCPEFLRERIGQILDRWPNPDGWFDP